MSYHYQVDKLEKLIGLFYRVNVIQPPSRPDCGVGIPIESILMAKGMLRILTTGGEMVVDIPHSQQVDMETYRSLVDLLGVELAKFIGATQYSFEIRNALHRDGVVVRFQDSIAVINPLKITSRESQWG